MDTIEVLKNHFIESGMIVPEKMVRFSKSGSRYYYSENIKPKVGITSFLSACLPMPKFLDSWRHEIGLEEANKILKDRANYGTVFHGIAADILRDYSATGSISFNFDEQLTRVVKENYQSFIPSDFNDFCYFLDEIKSDLLAFVKFMFESNMKAKLIETSLPSTTLDLAATLDFFGTMFVETKGFFGEVYKSGANAGQPKETKKLENVFAIIDFKTKRKKEIESDSDAANKQISLANKLQLNYQSLFLRQNYPQFENENIRLFNLIPKDWRTNPDVQLTEIDIIPDKYLIDFFNFWKAINPGLFDVNEKKVISISGTFVNSIHDVLKIETVENYLNDKLKSFIF